MGNAEVGMRKWQGAPRRVLTDDLCRLGARRAGNHYDMKFRAALLFLITAGLAGCQPQLPFTGDGEAARELPSSAAPGEPARGSDAGQQPEELLERERAAAQDELRDLLRRPAGRETICQTFVREIAEAAVAHAGDVDGFLAALQDEFIGGTDDPFEMKEGLRTGEWNQRYFYAGHGGFRPEYDDAQRYPRGGNHQPGHFIAVLSVAARFGEEQARIAIAYAGDYEPRQEDDLRLSNIAIPLGAGLRDRTVTPADVARRAAQLCR
jgi:hypothetical protein